MTVLLEDRLAELTRRQLDHGGHASLEEGMCVMEAVAWVAGEPWSDHPECVSPVIGAFMRQWNDDLDDEGRQRLKELIPLLVGKRDDRDEQRGWMCADWLIRVYTPAWLELA